MLRSPNSEITFNQVLIKVGVLSASGFFLAALWRGSAYLLATAGLLAIGTFLHWLALRVEEKS